LYRPASPDNTVGPGKTSHWLQDFFPPPTSLRPPSGKAKASGFWRFFLLGQGKKWTISVRFLPRQEYLTVDSASASRTSVTLLGRLRQDPTDQAAWGDFVERYGRKIYGWCRHWHLQDADAEDVTQTVLLLLAQKMRAFAYDPSRSFRSWLKTLTQHAWSDFVAGRKRSGQGSGDRQVEELLHSCAARDDLQTRLNAEFDQELLESAIVRVRLRVQPQTWEAFRLTALEGLSGAAAAEQLKLRVATEFNAKSKVLRMLQEELRKLEETST
jgi:RNA polymerase sigma-70 factor (ECF subfamily)